MIDWDLIQRQLQSKTIDELHELEREDYHVFLDRLTEAATPVERLSIYDVFEKVLRNTYESKIALAKIA